MSFAFTRSSRFWIAVAAIALIVGVRMTGLGDFLSFDTLRAHRGALIAWVGAHWLLACATYVLIYIGAVAFSVPGATLLTITGGFLFGTSLGAVLAATGAAIGATLVFLFAKALFGDRAIERLATQYPNLVKGIRDNAWSYLLALRFVPLFPFFLVNLAAAFVGVRLSTYVVTTLFGILPATAVFSLAGAGLGSLLDEDGEISLASILTPTILLALTGLAVLALAAIPVRKWLARGT
jgi:uncharacterized membrane protein YdjX (TVP38/TMEM64 family)